eukprot:COSAG01_NODE_66078_length_271_cov_0.813953_1_plen_33_part_10
MRSGQAGGKYSQTPMWGQWLHRGVVLTARGVTM